MNIIPHTTTAFTLEERITTANGVERRVSVEPAGNDRDEALKDFTKKVAANRPAYAPHTGIRIVLLGGPR